MLPAYRLFAPHPSYSASGLGQWEAIAAVLPSVLSVGAQFGLAERQRYLAKRERERAERQARAASLAAAEEMRRQQEAYNAMVAAQQPSFTDQAMSVLQSPLTLLGVLGLGLFLARR